MEEKKIENTSPIQEHFGFFGIATALYALLYALCMFKNSSGITFPFFVAGSLGYMYLCFSKLGISLQKGSIFQMLCTILLAIATFLTDDGRIIFFNKLGIFLLVMCVVLQHFYDTGSWGLGKFLGAILQMCGNSFTELGSPVTDGKEYFKEHKEHVNPKVVAGILGAVITLPLLAFILFLLSSADIMFREITTEIIAWLKPENLVNILIRTAICFFGVYALLRYMCGRHIKPEVKDRRSGEPVLMIIVTAALTVIYACFSGIQIVGLFLGKLQLPDGYTYAEYAREGFFQLLLVGIINLVIVLFTLTYFRESKALKIVMTLMSLCTFIMIASSAYRMVLNIRYYYLTFLRILVLWSLAVLCMLFVGVLLQIWKNRFPLFRYSMTLVSVLYIFLAFSHPDYWIAEVNLANARGQERSQFAEEFFLAEGEYYDFYYLSRLSADAAPVMIAYLEKNQYDFGMEVLDEESIPGEYWSLYQNGYRYLYRMKERTEGLSWRTFNVSRYVAARELDKRLQ